MYNLVFLHENLTHFTNNASAKNKKNQCQELKKSNLR